MYDIIAPVPAVQGTGGPHLLSIWNTRAEDKDSGGAHHAPEERRLVEAARRDRDAFAPLYRRYVAPVYRYFYHQVANYCAEDAEDLTSTTFSKALAGLDRYEAQGSFAAWLFGIARHTLLDYRRERYAEGSQVDVEVVAPLLADPGPQPEAQVLRAEQSARLRYLVGQLPDEQREALVLRIFAELRTREVAAVLGKSEGAVKMLVHRAIETLRTRYGARSQEAR